MKESEEDTIKGNIFHAHGLEELILLSCPYFWKQSTDSMQFLLKFQCHFPQKLNTHTHTHTYTQYWNLYGTRKDPEDPKQSWVKRQSWEYPMCWFKTELQSHSNQEYDIGIKNWHIDQWNKIESPKNKPMHTWSFNFWQRNQEFTMERTISSITSAGKTRQATCKRMKLDYYLTATQKPT